MQKDTPLYLRDEMDLSGFTEKDREIFEKFSKDGFVVIDLPVGDLPERIIAEVEYDETDRRRKQDAWKDSPAVRDLALDAFVMEKLAMLYGRKPFAFQTLNFPVGTQQLTHSDTIHFCSDPADYMAGVWVALEDIDEDNGPLHYFPGSHRYPQITLDDLGISGEGSKDMRIYREIYEPKIQDVTKGLPFEQGLIKKGQALIWSANLLHGGSPILDPARSRHSQVTHYLFDDCQYWTPLLSGGDYRHYRYPYDIASGRSVTPYGQLPVSENNLIRIKRKFGRVMEKLTGS